MMLKYKLLEHFKIRIPQICLKTILSECLNCNYLMEDVPTTTSKKSKN